MGRLNRRVEIYRDRRGLWRWRELPPNSRTNITAEGGEGYTRRYDAVKAFEKHRESMILGVDLVIEDGPSQTRS